MLGGEPRRLYHLSVPPGAAIDVIREIGEAEFAERARVIMEKPFGTDLASAVELNNAIHEVFDEDQVFRIDHFLGKEAAQNILALRFANGLFEPIWNATTSTTSRSTFPRRPTSAPASSSTSRRRLPRHGRHPSSFPGARVRRNGAADGARPRADQRGEEQGFPLTAIP